jgi:GH15 family glucan-1,4-alpha-glucosidase
MAWVAFDRAVQDVEQFALDGPVDDWRRTRDAIHAEVCEHGFDAGRRSFVQHYGATGLDASLLLIPLVGFLPIDDPRVRGTVDAIQRELTVDGLVMRYSTRTGVDGLPPGEGAFLPCTLWLADCLALSGRCAEAEALFEHVLLLSNDVGLLAEEFDPRERRMLGNFPQALSHTALVNTAHLLSMSPQQIARSVALPGGPIRTEGTP